MLSKTRAKLNLAVATLLMTSAQAQAAVTIGASAGGGSTALSALLNVPGLSFGITAILGVAAFVSWATFFNEFNGSNAIAQGWKPVALSIFAWQWPTIIALFGFQ